MTKMRHRDEQAATSKTVVNTVTGTLSRFTSLLSEEETASGRHKLPAGQPVIPTQKVKCPHLPVLVTCLSHRPETVGQAHARQRGMTKMRHRDEHSATSKTVVNTVTGTLSRFTSLLSEEETASGKHKLPTSQPVIPTQKVPTHETVEARQVDGRVGGEVEVRTAPEVVEPVEIAQAEQQVEQPVELATHVTAAWPSPGSIPATAQWKAGHGPRMFAASLLLLAVAGTSALGLRYTQTRGSDEFLSTVVGIAVVVGLWALLIASTPQVVSLRGSILTVRNSSGSERFDLADGLQPVDVVGQPRSSGWALLLHRPNNTSVVLRRRDVDAVALDPIVRHYRAIAEQRYSDRQVRFSR
jgi:hypothetical protein